MTTISPNYANVNFRATEQVQPKKAAETNAQSKPESKGMSNAMKAGIGVGALAVATAVIAGIAIKNKNAAKEAAKKFAPMAEKVGLTPVAYQKLSTKLDEIKKYEKFDLKDALDNIDEFNMNSPLGGGSMCLLNMSDSELRTGIAKSMKLKANDIPENSLYESIKDGKGVTKQARLLIFDEMTQSMKDAFGDGSVIEIPIKKV